MAVFSKVRRDFCRLSQIHFLSISHSTPKTLTIKSRLAKFAFCKLVVVVFLVAVSDRKVKCAKSRLYRKYKMDVNNVIRRINTIRAITIIKGNIAKSHSTYGMTITLFL